MENINDTTVDHQFIVMYYAIYTTGGNGGTNDSIVLNILDNHVHKIRAVITGHHHMFTLFDRKGVFFIGVSPAGGGDEISLFSFGSGRKFSGFRTGPLPVTDERDVGYEYHVESFVWRGMKIKVYLDVFDDRFLYTVVNLKDGSVIR